MGALRGIVLSVVIVCFVGGWLWLRSVVLERDALRVQVSEQTATIEQMQRSHDDIERALSARQAELTAISGEYDAAMRRLGEVLSDEDARRWADIRAPDALLGVCQ